MQVAIRVEDSGTSIRRQIFGAMSCSSIRMRAIGSIMIGYHADGFAQRDGGYLLGGLPVVFACLASLVVSTVCLRPSPLSIANCDRRAA